jgi:cytosine/uracil/thiamine/allantoin permease
MSLLSPKNLGQRIKAKIEPQLHRRVPFQAGVYANSPRWSNKDLDPIPPEKRTWGGFDYWAYWTSDMVSLDSHPLHRIPSSF